LPRVPIPDHPGFWRRGKTVVFKYRDERGKQRWSSAPNLRTAERRKKELEVDVSRGEYRARSRVTFKAYALQWVETYQGRTSRLIDEATRDDYRRRLKEEAIPYFEEMLLVDVEPQDVKAFIRTVSTRPRRGKRWKKTITPLSPNTVRLALAPVKAMFATAFEEGLIRVNPAAGVRVVAPTAQVELDEDDVGPVKALTRAELDALMAAVPKEWKLFFAVLLHLGLRIGEIIELRWRDLGAAGPDTVKVRRKFYDGRVGAPKSRYGRRTLKLTPELSAALWQLRKDTRGRDGDLVFTAAEGGRIDASNLMSRVLKKAGRKAGVGWVGFHTFRHTCATLLFTEQHWNAKQVQLWLGHHKASFTVDTYIHLLPSDLPDAPELVTLTAVEGKRKLGENSGAAIAEATATMAAG
jgi:integrase